MYGGDAPEEIRKHMDSGVLEKLFAKKEQEMLKPSKSAWHPDYTFVLLGACAMTLGCRIHEHYKLQMQKHFLNVGMLETPERQIFKALNGPDGYQEGVPYKFEVPEDVVAAHEAEMKRRDSQGGAFVMMNVPAPFGFIPAPPPKNKVLRTKMDEAKYGEQRCGGCGADKKKDGETLLRCGKCMKRGYCSVECQKEHWSLHKKVCKVVQDSQGHLAMAVGRMSMAPVSDLLNAADRE